MRLGRTSRTNPLSVALLLVQVTVWRSTAYLEREPRLRRVESWKKLLPWLDPPAAKLRDGQPFFVVWNAPSFRCGRQYDMPMDLKKFGIVANDLELFHGDVINLFYENRLGLYPKIMRNGISFNGGIPQLANLTAHLEWVKADVEWYIPNKTYDGLAVIDWEAWQPLFERNHGRGKRRYLLRALAVVMSRHPWWRGRHVYTKTQREFDAAARRLMDATQTLCQRLRPNAKWGFYLFPSCFNKRPYQNYCTKSTLHQNDQLHWLFRKSKALYPSIYLKYQQHPEVQRLYVEGVLRETFRVSMRHGRKDAQVIPYARYTYPKNSQFYTKSDLESSIGQAADSGAAGVVLWETYKNIQNRSDCLKVRSYLHTVLGPFVSDVLKFTERCSQELCHGRGRCVSRQWSSYGLLSTREHPIHRVRARPRRSVRQDRRESVPLSDPSAALGKVEFTAGVNDLTEFTSDGVEKDASSDDDAVDVINDEKDFPEKRIFSNTLGYKSADNNESTGGLQGVHLKALENAFDGKPIKTGDPRIPTTIGIPSSPEVEKQKSTSFDSVQLPPSSAIFSAKAVLSSTKPLVLESISIEPLSYRSSFSESFSSLKSSELLTPTAFLSSEVLSSDLVPATENIPTPALSAELLPSTEFLPTPFLSSEPLRSAGSFTKTLLTSALSSSESLPKALSSSELVSSTESPSTTPLSLELVSSTESSPTLTPFSSELISRSELLPMDVSSSELPPSAVSWPTPSVSIELLSSVEVLPTTHLSSELLSSTKPLPMEPLSSELASVTESFSTPLASKLISSTQSLPVLPFPTELLESPGHLFSEPLSTLQYVPVSSVSSVNPVSERTASISTNSAHTKFTASEQSNSPEVPALTEGKKTYPTKANQQQKVLKRKKLKSKINIENATTHKKRRRRRRKKKKTMHRYSNYRCRCYDGWTGNFCQHQIFK